MNMQKRRKNESTKTVIYIAADAADEPEDNSRGSRKKTQ
jgi:hypothetical protein